LWSKRSFKYLEKKIKWLKSKDSLDKNNNIKSINFVSLNVQKNVTHTHKILDTNNNNFKHLKIFFPDKNLQLESMDNSIKILIRNLPIRTFQFRLQIQKFFNRHCKK